MAAVSDGRLRYRQKTQVGCDERRSNPTQRETLAAVKFLWFFVFAGLFGSRLVAHLCYGHLGLTGKGATLAAHRVGF